VENSISIYSPAIEWLEGASFSHGNTNCLIIIMKKHTPKGLELRTILMMLELNPI